MREFLSAARSRSEASWGPPSRGFASGAIAGGSLKAGLQGAFSGALFFGVGQAVGNAGLSAGGSVANGGEFAAAITLHGVAGCIASVAGGGKCGPGALSAAFSKAALPLTAGVPDGLGRGFAHAIIGGTGSVLGGGKFANGAQTGAFSYLFNFCKDCFNDFKDSVLAAWDYVGNEARIVSIKISLKFRDITLADHKLGNSSNPDASPIENQVIDKMFSVGGSVTKGDVSLGAKVRINPVNAVSAAASAVYSSVVNSTPGQLLNPTNQNAAVEAKICKAVGDC